MSSGSDTDIDWRGRMFAKGTKAEIGQRLGIQYTMAMQPTITISYGEVSMDFHQESMGLMAISGVVWDAGLLMVDYLKCLVAETPMTLVGNILDIGCGTGIAGISALVLGENNVVVFTDIDKLPCFEYNIEQLSSQQQSRHDFIAYLWNEKMVPDSFLFGQNESLTSNQSVRIWDTLLCSDLLYEEKSHFLLISVLRRIQFKRAIFTYKKRHEVPEEKFFAALSEWCSIRVVNPESISLVNLPRTSLSGLYVVVVEPLKIEP